MNVYWHPVSYKKETDLSLTRTLIRVRCSGSNCSFDKPSSELMVAGALCGLLQFLAIWPLSLQLKHFLRAKQLPTKWSGFWQLLQNGLLFWEVRSVRSFSMMFSGLVRQSLVEFWPTIAAYSTAWLNDWRPTLVFTNSNKFYKASFPVSWNTFVSPLKLSSKVLKTLFIARSLITLEFVQSSYCVS